jgi:hypothetical protein
MLSGWSSLRDPPIPRPAPHPHSGRGPSTITVSSQWRFELPTGGLRASVPESLPRGILPGLPGAPPGFVVHIPRRRSALGLAEDGR